MENINNDNYDILIKFSDYVDDIKKGLFFCHNLNYFRKADPSTGLGDSEEGMIFTPKKTIQLDGNKVFLFCMLALEPTEINSLNNTGFFKLSESQIKKFKIFGTQLRKRSSFYGIGRAGEKGRLTKTRKATI